MRVVIAAYGSRGDVEPCIAVAGELHRRGHDVQMAITVPPELCAHIESLGLSAHPYGRDWRELLTDQEFTRMLSNPLGAIPQAIDYVSRVGAQKSATLTALARGADLVLAGMTEERTAATVAQHSRIPLAALHFFPPEVLRQDSANHADDDPGSRATPLEIQAYDELCFPELAATWAGRAVRRPFVGALSLQLPTDGDDETLEWIHAGPPPVYFGFGSMPIPSPADMVAVISEAASRLGYRALICLGPNHCDDDPAPGHVKVVREVNHALVFPDCRAVVHHGGAGTTAAALRSGVPNLVLWSGLDQPMWAAAVTALKAGFGRPFSESTLDSVTADLDTLAAPDYATNAALVALMMSTPDQSLCRTVDLVERAADHVDGPAEDCVDGERP